MSAERNIGVNKASSLQLQLETSPYHLIEVPFAFDLDFAKTQEVEKGFVGVGALFSQSKCFGQDNK